MTDTKRVVAADIKMADDDGGPGGFVAIISTDSKDRDGEILDKGWWKADGNVLPDRVHIDVDHSMSIEKTVGSGRPFETPEGDLAIEAEFTSLSLGQDVRTLMAEGHVDGLSVTFRGAKTYEGKDDTLHIKSAEFMNLGVVAIPSNRDAKVLTSKSAAAFTALGIEYEDLTDDVADGPAFQAVIVDDTTEGEKAADEPELMTLEDAKALLEDEREAEQKRALLDHLLSPEMQEKRFASTGLPSDRIVDLIGDAKGFAVVTVPEGVDYVTACKTAQEAVDEISSATTAPTPDESAAAQAAADSEALATARAKQLEKAATIGAGLSLAKAKARTQ